MTAPKYYVERVKTRLDKWGLIHCECPNWQCNNFIPNVEEQAKSESIVTCPKCQTTFRLVKPK